MKSLIGVTIFIIINMCYILTGGRGFTCDTWTTNSWVPDIRTFDPNATNVDIHDHYHQMHTDFATCVNDPTFVKTTSRLAGRLTAYFVPPSSGIYRFGTISDDSSVVYFSNTSSPMDKVVGVKEQLYHNITRHIICRAETRTLIGGGGGVYSYIHVLPDEFLF